MSKISTELKKIDSVIYAAINTEAAAENINDDIRLLADNYYSLSKSIRRACRMLDGLYISRELSALHSYLVERGFSPTQSELCQYLQDAGASEELLTHLHGAIIYCCVKELYKLFTHGKCENSKCVLELLDICEELDYGSIYESSSSLHKQLLQYDDYYIGDEQTRRHYASAICRYAKKHKQSPGEALSHISQADLSELVTQGGTYKKYLYFISIISLTLILFVLCCIVFDVSSYPFGLIIALLLLPSFYGGGRFLVDYSFSKLCSPRPVMRISKEACDDKYKTLTVITALLSDGDEIYRSLEDMYLCNREDIFNYGILADLPDAESQYTPEDEASISYACDRINALRRKYGNRFFLFIREREYSRGEKCFTARERKRGAVIELSRLLCGKESTLKIMCGEKDELDGTRYAITLDSDTLIAPGEASLMVRCAAHPINRPVIDPHTHRVIRGHGIFQPAVRVRLASGSKTYFSLLSSSCRGFCGYNSTSFESYGDIFDESNFCGKGIFDVKCFEECISEAFCDGVILSHDLLEGLYLRCGGMSDVSLYDSTPSNALSYYKRLDRWIRGDIQALTQSLGYVKTKNGVRKNPLGALCRFKLIDNVIGHFTPLASLIAFLAALLFPHKISACCSVFAVFHIIVPCAVRCAEGLFFSSFGITRKYRSVVMSSFWNTFFSSLLKISSLPHEALTATRALIYSAKGLITKKHLLRWVSAASAERSSLGTPSEYIIVFSFSLLLGFTVACFVNCGLYRFFGLTFMLCPFVMYFLSRPIKYPSDKKTAEDISVLREYAADSWKYFDELVCEKYNYLPPDNYSEIAHHPVATRTSPTNIGLYMLVCLCVCDLRLINAHQLSKRLKSTLATIKKLKKYKGNLYNWYDTETLDTLDDFVSSVDMGNYLACLITLSQGLEEYFAQDMSLYEIKRDIDDIIAASHPEVLYDEKKHLFATGLRVGIGLSSSHYDIYMSEARTLSYIAVALGRIPPSHIGAPLRVVLSQNGYIGLGSWSGTCFEYFMPSLFLPTPRGSLQYEALRFAYAEQLRHRAVVRGKQVFGISESCYYAFDKMMNYQYKAHGIGTLSLGVGITQYVISPYSSFLMLGMSREALKNLATLRSVGAYGKYGFYEAIDLDLEGGGEYAVIRCFMSHHIGMSLIAIGNLCLDNIFVKRFIRDARMHSCLLFGEERIPVDELPYRPSRSADLNIAVHPLKYDTGKNTASGVISNTRDKLVFNELGQVALSSGNYCLTRPLAKRLGLTVFSSDSSLLHIPSENAVLKCTGREYNATLHSLSVSLSLSATSAVFACDISSDNESMVCFEPILAPWDEYSRHIAFSRLFVTFDCEDGLLYFTRKSRTNGNDAVLCIAAVDETGNVLELEYEAVFDKILGVSPSMDELWELFSKKLRSSNINASEACVRPFFVGKCKSKHYRMIFSFSHRKTQAKENMLKFLHASDDKRELFPKLDRAGGLFVSALAGEHTAPSVAKTPGLSHIEDLWAFGLSGEDKLFLIDLRKANAPYDGVGEYLKGFFLLCRSLLVANLRFDTAVIYPEVGYDNGICDIIDDMLRKCGVYLLKNEKHGFHLIKAPDEAVVSLLIDSAFCRVEYPSIELCGISKPQKELNAVVKYEYAPSESDVRSIAKRRNMRIMSYIYSTPEFGTLLTSSSLGFTYFGSSHFNKITQFDTDAMDENGEKLYMLCDGVYYDLCACSHTVKWHDGCAVYLGCVNKEKYMIRVTVSSSSPTKLIAVDLDSDKPHRLIYSCRFVLGERKTETCTLRAKHCEKYLLVENMYSEEKKRAYIYSDCAVSSAFDGCLGTLEAYGGNVTFTIGYLRADEECICKERCIGDAVRLYKSSVEDECSHFVLSSPNKSLDFMFKMSLYQALHCRMYARCGFYQNGGAYGYRDQLQDCLAIIYSHPKTVREHIIRCAGYQYDTGDVMHWFHDDIRRGVRTRCSDDLLWLVYVVFEYVTATGDEDILTHRVEYITSPQLSEDETDRYESAVGSGIKESIYMHCVRAVELSLKRCECGLPLFGSGDWNDGMNEVGGQSVWLAFFMIGVLNKMASLARIVSDDTGEKKYSSEAQYMENAVEEFAFTGKYYIRGTYKSGEAIGKCGGDIDILPQAFAAFHGHDKQRIAASLATAYRELYDSRNKLVKLLTPPYTSQSQVGYIGSYPPGIRENGGQYTHAAVWLAAAFLKFGQAKKGYELLCAVNPCDRLGDNEAIEQYGAEPYVLAGDVYTAHGHEGEGGWSWYTGSAGWFYQTVLNCLLGYRHHATYFTLEPCLCREFDRFELVIRQSNTTYKVSAKLSDKSKTLLDGKKHDGACFAFDGKEHILELEIKK